METKVERKIPTAIINGNVYDIKELADVLVTAPDDPKEIAGILRKVILDYSRIFSLYLTFEYAKNGEIDTDDLGRIFLDANEISNNIHTLCWLADSIDQMKLIKSSAESLECQIKDLGYEIEKKKLELSKI